MAGIGFELRKLLRKDSFLADVSAYLYAALISSGPWLMSILCLSILGLYRQTGFPPEKQEIFRSTVIYTYALSIVFIGGVQLVVTRYLADLLYAKEHRHTLRAFFTSALWVLAGGTAFAALFYRSFALSPLYKAVAVILFQVTCLIWLAMIFVSAVKDYKSIVYAFAVGTAVSVLAAIGLDRVFPYDGYLMGFTLGQAVILFWLVSCLLTEFPAAGLWDRGLVRHFRRYWDLACIGLAYNLAIWVDKVVFWFAPDSRLIAPWFRTHDIYEAPVFFAYLSIVPTLAVFLIKIETKFYEHYQRYYAKIMGNQSLSSILEEKRLMVAMLQENFREVFVLQGAITGLGIIFAKPLLAAVKLIPLQAPLLRVALIGAFLQALLSINIIILFYFDLRKRVLALSLLFLVLNTGLSWWSTRLGFQFYGYGYCYASLVTFAASFWVLSRSLEDLEYITFAKQPLA